jgi:hypothetical protein
VFHQRGVDFDGHHARGTAQELLRQRPAAGTDFDHQVFTRRANSLRDTLQNARVGEEVLTEFLRQVGR